MLKQDARQEHTPVREIDDWPLDRLYLVAAVAEHRGSVVEPCIGRRRAFQDSRCSTWRRSCGVYGRAQDGGRWY